VNTSYESTGSFPGVSTVRACGGILRCSGDGSEGSVGCRDGDERGCGGRERIRIGGMMRAVLTL